MALVTPKDAFGNTIMTLTEIGLSGYVRFARFPQGIRFSEIDVVKAVTGKDNDYANQIIRRLDSATTDEVRAGCTTFKFKGRGQQDTVLITYTGLIKLIMHLPGENAKIMRSKFANILHRFFAGDASLMEEIEKNKESTSPIHEFARETLNEERSDSEDTQLALIQRIRNELTKEIQNEVQKEVQAVVEYMKKEKKADRRKQITDENRKNKHELAVKEKEGEIALKKQRVTAELEIQRDKAALDTLERRLTLEKQYDEIDKAKCDRHMTLLDKEIQLKTLAAAIPQPEKLPAGPLTTRTVGEHYGIYKGVSKKYIIRISNAAADKVQKPPHSLQPLGRVVDIMIGKTHPHFNPKDIKAVKEVVEECKQLEGQYDNIYEAIPEAIVVAM